MCWVIRIKAFMHVIGVSGGFEKHRQDFLFLIKRRGRQALDGKCNRPDIPFTSVLTSNPCAKLPTEIEWVISAEKKTTCVFIGHILRLAVTVPWGAQQAGQIRIIHQSIVSKAIHFICKNATIPRMLDDSELLNAGINLPGE